MGAELSVDEKAVGLGPQLSERSKNHLVGCHEVRHVEKYFLIRIAADDVDPTRATQPDNIREHPWWTIAELRVTDETVYSESLADLAVAVTEGRVPKRPIVLS
ncbi:NUDIX hydrolase [Streptomyces bobili]|uniref:NUDIX hydrolase n=1 Tax=Streptomyces bobili TaxID=67280 RepID=UPI003713491C